MTTPHQCHICQGRLEERTVSRVQEYQGRYVLIENLPALVCTHCGETYFTPAAHDRVVALLQGDAAPVRVVELPVYDAARG